MNPWNEAFRKASQKEGFLNLIDTNFHKALWIHPKEVLEPLWGQYLDTRVYSPDPRGNPDARKALKGFYSRYADILITEEDFFLTASTSEAYSILFRLLCSPGDALLLPKPGYPLFEHLGNLSGAGCTYYELEPPDWRLTREALEVSLTPRTRVLVLISPHNPTGRVFTREEIALSLDFCREHGLSLVWDEVFDPWVFSGETLPRPWQVTPSVPVFLLNGISKRFACADLKLGWILVQGPESWKQGFMERLEMANDTLLSANGFSQFLLPRLFDISLPLLGIMKDEAQENREYLVRTLGSLSLPLPEGGLHCVLNFPESPWEDEVLGVKLLKAGLALHPGYFYDLPGCRLVLSLVHNPRKFQKKIECLLKVLRNLV